MEILVTRSVAEERRYAEALMSSSLAIIELARALQRSAFANQPERIEAEFSGPFAPAPCYLGQAKAIATDIATMREVVIALQDVVKQSGPR